MANNKITKKNTDKKETKKQDYYKNPVNTLWGRILIWVLCIAMVGAAFASVIMALVGVFS